MPGRCSSCLGWSRVLLPAPEEALRLGKSSSPRSCFHELLPGEPEGFLSLSYLRPIWPSSNSGNRRSRLSACRQRRGRGRQSRWEKISPAGRNRRCLNKCYGHLSSPRERRLLLRRSSSSDLSLHPLRGFCSPGTRVVPDWRRAGRKHCPGLALHRSIIKVRGGRRGLRCGICPVFPDIIRGFRRGRALALSGLLLIPGRRFVFALLLSPFLFFRSPSTSFFPALTRGPAGPFSIFEILTDGEAAQDNADEEAGCAPGRCSQEEKDRG